MATYKEICESVLEEVNGRGDTFASLNLGRDGNGELYVSDPTQRNIIRWVNDLYVQMQQQFIQADFMHARDVLFSTVVGQQQYEVEGIRAVNTDSVFLTKAGSTAKIPVEVEEYRDWLIGDTAGSTIDSRGTPMSLIRMPDESWLVDPVPTEVWNVNADFWYEPSGFVDGDEEPRWSSLYHDILKWRALLLFSTEFSEEKSVNVVLERVKIMLGPLDRAFKKRYIPPITGPEGF